ncbi:LETM1-related biofilm-associated protein [Mesonia aquimarina]|uniref:LETM1-related biofilm-associated protein n=1 Tax=Mesonia aquimarina TaxID=1504967 RepID=UPI000EF5F940|nr:LETM1-related biofilm-associated protein [Mesonia aquimarina]
MNPSASGWINKHFPVSIDFAKEHISEENFYGQLRETGFLYANSVTTFTYKNRQVELDWTTEELTKINLFDSLVYIYTKEKTDASKEDCINTIIDFYKKLEKQNKSFFKISFFKNSAEEKLEKILHHRIQTNKSVFQKNFSNIITNALLFIDVLAFQHFLSTSKNPFSYSQELEGLLTNTIYLAFQEKGIQSKYEKLILKLLQNSLRYTAIDQQYLDFEELNFSVLQHQFEKNYLLDLSCISVYSDEELEKNEFLFLKKLNKELLFPNDKLLVSIKYMVAFLKKHKGEISYFSYSNAVKHFYNNTNRMVSVLILRNKKRLLQELNESRELVILLHKSSKTDLNETEKQKVKNQLLDICKSVPSLAIFILPGGSVLLPILIKFIPQLLPSAFNENRIEKP